MDPIAHTLFGAALSRTPIARSSKGPGRREVSDTYLAGATLALVVGANLPDVDAALYFLGSDLSLFLRRGLTHGPLGMLLLPPLFVLAWRLFRRWRAADDLAWGRLLILVYLGALSHPALDWLNTYGVRFLAPFDWRWFYGDTLFIVDPWMWLLLGAATILGRQASVRIHRLFRVLAVLASLLMVLVGVLGLVPVGAVVLFVLAVVVVSAASSRRGPSVRLATGLVVAFFVYVLVMIVAARTSRHLVEASLEEQGFELQELVVGPLPATPLAREWVAMTEHEYRVGTFSWLERPRVQIAEQTFPRIDPDEPSVQAALGDSCIRGFVNWMRLPSVEVVAGDPSGSHEVRFFDLRYSRAPVEGFGGARSVVAPPVAEPDARLHGD